MDLEQFIKHLASQGVALRLEDNRLVIQTSGEPLAADTQALLTDFEEEISLWLQSQANSDETWPQAISSPATRYQPFPLTDIQHAYWVGRSGTFALGDVSTHVYFEIGCQTIDVARLNAAWRQVVKRHEMLRAIVNEEGQQQILDETPEWNITVYDLRGQSQAQIEEHINSIRAELSHQVLPSDRWPLFDIRASQLNQGETRLHLSLDVLFCDFASLLMLLNEWQRAYQQPTHLPPPPDLSFRDYVLAAQQIEQTPRYQQAADYWRKRLSSLPAAPELPLAQEPNALQETRTRRRSARLDRQTWTRLQQRGGAYGLTANGILLAAFAEVLALWSKQPSFTLNLTLFNRLPLHPQVNEVIGDFTTINLLAVDYTQSAAFSKRAQQLQNQLWQDLDHRVFSGVRVLRELAQQQGVPGRGVQMPIIFTSGLGFDAGAGLQSFGKLVYGSSQTPQAWLDHVVLEEAGELTFHWDTVEALFPTGMLDAIFTCYCDLLQRLTDEAQLWQAISPARLSAAELMVFQQANATEAPLSAEMLHTLFLQQVAVHADDLAVLTTNRCLSYGELYQRANQVGHWLRTHEVQPNTLVAVVMEKGWEQVVAVLGIHLAGAAYLPIDANLPSERQRYLLQQGEVVFALTQSKLDDQIDWLPTVHRLVVDTLTPDHALPALPIVQQPTDLAYVIYTSGSTGQPKGVMIDQRGAVNTVLDINRRFGVTAQDRVLALSALNFDLSVYDIFGLLAVGGSIVLPDADLRNDPDHWIDLMTRHHVTLWNTVPALMQMLVDTLEARQADKGISAYPELAEGRQSERLNGNHAVIPSSCHPVIPSLLSLVMLSGDWIPVTLPDRIKALWTGVTVYGLGGATEASIWSNYFLIDKVEPTWSSIPYGKPLANQSFHILNSNLSPRPVWVPGDLYIGGIGLALGYWKDPEKSNAKFIHHSVTGERLYKTGDLGRYWPDGNIEFLGREDFQVKIRGHRIELGEIENALLQHPAVKEAVVNAVGDAKGQRQLVGYIVLDKYLEKSQQEKEERSPVKTPPDVYEQLHQAAITDPIARLEFKLRQPGIRQQLENQPVVLPSRLFDPNRCNTWLMRQSYRHFLAKEIPLERFSDFLSCLQQMPIADMPLPKYRYPSAGNLYPVQSYLYVKSGRIEGLAGGFYYYHPAAHHLVPLQVDENRPGDDFQVGEANRELFSQAAFTLFLVTDLAAIAPLYGAIAHDFSLLEAGYMSQLLMTEAPQHELGLCPIGVVDSTILQSACALGEGHRLLHCLAGGRIEASQMNSWLQGEEQEKSRRPHTTEAPWSQRFREHLAQKLPDYMIPTAYVVVDALPLSSNGKVDRKMLPAPDIQATQTHNLISPTTPTQITIATIWSNVLKVPQIDIATDFFELGGDSLLATQVISRLRTTFKIGLSLRDFFAKPTVADLAEQIDLLSKAQGLLPTTPLLAGEEEEVW